MILFDGTGNEIQVNSDSDVRKYKASEKVVYSLDTITVNGYQQIILSLEPGRYVLYCDKITSNDVDADVCNIYFVSSVYGEITNNYCERGENIRVEFDLFNSSPSFVFCCSDNVVHASGDTATFEGIVITKYDDTELAKYPFWGKKFAIIGDSFSAGKWMWSSTMCQELHAIQHAVVGESGARWTDNADRPDIPSAYRQAQLLVERETSPDYIYAFLGTNDCGNKITIGELVKSKNIEDFDLHTVCGGVQACLNYLQNNFPNAVIKTGFTPNGKFYASALQDCEPYANAIKEISAWYAVQYMDVLTCGLSTLSSVYEDCWEIPSAVTGGHPNQKGHAYIGRAIARKTLFGD